jgi:hypothetical protein
MSKVKDIHLKGLLNQVDDIKKKLIKLEEYIKFLKGE